MNQKEKPYPLREMVRQMIPLYGNCQSIQQLLFTMEHLETNIQNWEARLEHIQTEVEILIAQQ